MNHHKIIKEEFTQQAETLSTSPIFTDRHLVERIKSAAEISKKSRILDIGCGPGIVAAALATEAKEVIAFDLTPAMIHRTRLRCIEAKLTNVQFVVGHAEKIPLNNTIFDVVMTRLTFHHFSNPVAVSSEIVRVLRPNGKIVIVDIVSSEDPEEAKLHNALEILRDPSHVRMFSPSEFKALVESAGLKITMEDSWTQKREFSEWIQITNAPNRAVPLFTVMQNIAKVGLNGGIDLQYKGKTVVFNHQWILLTAEKI